MYLVIVSPAEAYIGSLFHWTHMHSLDNLELSTIPRVHVEYEITVDSQRGT